MKTITDIQNCWETYRAFASDAGGVSENQAAGWRRNNTIPSKYLLRIASSQVAIENGITLGLLASICAGEEIGRNHQAPLAEKAQLA